MTEHETAIVILSALSIGSLWHAYYMYQQASVTLQKAVERCSGNIRQYEVLMEFYALWRYGAQEGAYNLLLENQEHFVSAENADEALI